MSIGLCVDLLIESDLLWSRYGIIDLGWRNEKEVWAVGGGGTMYVSMVKIFPHRPPRCDYALLMLR